MPYGADAPQMPPGLPPGAHEVIHTDDRVVACDGGSAGSGHPRVWLRIVHTQTYCPYCSRIFALTPGGQDSGH